MTNLQTINVNFRKITKPKYDTRPYYIPQGYWNVQMSIFKMIKILFFLIFISSCNNAYSETEKNKQIDKSDLHSMLLSFADTYLENIAQVSDIIILETDDPYLRLNIHSTKVLYVTSVVNIVTEPAELEQFFDMLVMIRLQRLVWESGKVSLGHENYELKFTETLKKLEQQVYRIADRVIPKTEFKLLINVIDEWHLKNHDETNVAFIRFKDLDASNPVKKLNNVMASGGLLSPVKDAVREIKESRLTAERALFLANHAPLLLQWQLELFTYKFAVTSEAKSLLESSQHLGNSTTELIEVIREFNKFLPKQSELIIQQLAKEVTQQRIHFVDQLSEQISSQREELFKSLQESKGTLNILLDRTQNSAQNINEATSNIIQIINSLDRNSSEKMTTDEIMKFLSESRQISDNLIIFSSAILKIIQIDNNQFLNDANSLAIEHEQRVFKYAIFLIFLIFVLSSILIFLSKKTAITNCK